MEKAKLVVFDMDGTLYQFPDGGTFLEIPFGQKIQQNTKAFIGREFELDEAEAAKKHEELFVEFDGELSLGLERKYGVDRMRFFEETWSLDPAEFIIPEPGVREALEQVDAQRVLLSAAPRVWVNRVLGFMGIADVFGERIFTGEPDIRKPSPLIFQQILNTYEIEACEAVSIGDQEYTDIAPARSIGMRALRIGAGDTEAEFSAPSIREAINVLRQEGVL